jgi:predicted nucleic acid-binding protein
MKRCTLDTNIITAFLKNDLRVVERVSNYLEKDGNLIEDADILMAAIAIVEDLVLITNNTSHFNRVKGLSLDNWLNK